MSYTEKLAFELNITGHALENYVSREDHYEYSLNHEQGEFMELTYPKEIQALLDAPYETILEYRDLLVPIADYRLIQLLDKAMILMMSLVVLD